MSYRIRVEHELGNIEELAWLVMDALPQHEDVIELIKHLDAKMEDWDATEALLKYFQKEMEDFEEECG